LRIPFLKPNLTKTSIQVSEWKVTFNGVFVGFMLLNKQEVSDHVTLISHPTLISWCQNLWG